MTCQAVTGKGDYVIVNPPYTPLTTEELDHSFDLPYTRLPHPKYKDKRIPAYEMIRFSELITKDMAHCRVDWYEINGKLFFGEITFFDGSGIAAFDNYADDLMLGSWIDLKKAYCQ